MIRRNTSLANQAGFPGQQAEAFRVLRSNLSVVLSSLNRAIVVVTSAQPGEGKTSITANLARSMAAAGRRIVLVDFDLRHPDLHNHMEAVNEVGVTNVLLQRLPLEQALQFIPIGRRVGQDQRGVYFLPTGPQVENPTELLGSSRTAEMLDALAAQADVVLIDSPPVLAVADTLVISRLATGALLVLEPRRTPTAAILRAKDALIRNQSRVLGLVMNKYQSRDAGEDRSYGYGYGYGYEPDPDDA